MQLRSQACCRVPAPNEPYRDAFPLSAHVLELGIRNGRDEK